MYMKNWFQSKCYLTSHNKLFYRDFNNNDVLQLVQDENTEQ